MSICGETASRKKRKVAFFSAAGGAGAACVGVGGGRCREKRAQTESNQRKTRNFVHALPCLSIFERIQNSAPAALLCIPGIIQSSLSRVSSVLEPEPGRLFYAAFSSLGMDASFFYPLPPPPIPSFAVTFSLSSFHSTFPELFGPKLGKACPRG